MCIRDRPLIFWALRPRPTGCGRWRLVERTAGVLVLVVLNPVVIGALLPESRWAWPLLLNGSVAVLAGVVLAGMQNGKSKIENRRG